MVVGRDTDIIRFAIETVRIARDVRATADVVAGGGGSCILYQRSVVGSLHLVGQLSQHRPSILQFSVDHIVNQPHYHLK